jgi:two-component system response regulator (stage 0 sporulation protein F)
VKKTKLLIVDDEPAVLLVCEKALGKFFLEIKTAGNEIDALSLLRKHHFNAILVDFKLRDRESLEVIREARRLYPDIRSILMTGTLNSDKLEKKVQRAKINRVIFKPFTIDELRGLVRECLNLATP